MVAMTTTKPNAMDSETRLSCCKLLDAEIAGMVVVGDADLEAEALLVRECEADKDAVLMTLVLDMMEVAVVTGADREAKVVGATTVGSTEMGEGVTVVTGTIGAATISEAAEVGLAGTTTGSTTAADGP